MGTDQESQLNEAGIHLEPRRQEEYAIGSHAPPTNVDQPPTQTRREIDATFLAYPRWVTLLTRGPLTIFEFAALIYGIWFYKKWESYRAPENVSFAGGSYEEFPKSRYDLALAAVGVGIGMDLIVCILTLFGIYGTCWMWFIFTDVGIGATGIFGLVSISWVDQNGYSKEELGWFWADDGQLLAIFALVVGVAHVTASFGGCIGCCVFCCKDRVSEREG